MVIFDFLKVSVSFFPDLCAQDLAEALEYAKNGCTCQMHRQKEKIFVPDGIQAGFILLCDESCIFQV